MPPLPVDGKGIVFSGRLSVHPFLCSTISLYLVYGFLRYLSQILTMWVGIS